MIQKGNLALGLWLLGTFGAQAQDATQFYASGWPINLAEAACQEDEACLTRLANCGPGTDGLCTDQVARCEVGGRDAPRAPETLCTVALERGAQGLGLVARLADGTQTYWPRPGLRVIAALRNPHSSRPPVCAKQNGRALCFTHVIDTETLSEWALKREPAN